jgi:hypothetical protein
MPIWTPDPSFCPTVLPHCDRLPVIEHFEDF